MPSKQHRSTAKRLRDPKLLVAVPVIVTLSQHYGGETALVAAAVLLPLIVALISNMRDDAQPAGDRDGLTGLMLRDGLIAWTERPRASASGKQLAVIALAIDDFDMIEDRFGRAMHDRIFVQAVPRLQALLKENHALARIGDTFALGLDDIPVPEGETLGIIARRIQTAFEEPFTNGPARTYCSVSIGIAVGTRIGASPGRDMVTSAMRAAETAALSGPGTVRVYDHVPQGAAQGCADPAQKLHNALETKMDQILLLQQTLQFGLFSMTLPTTHLKLIQILHINKP